MILLANELSIHEQFNNVNEFSSALTQFMSLRKTAENFGRDIFHNEKIFERKPSHCSPLYQYINKLERDKKRTFLNWLGKYNLEQIHTGSDWLESNGEIVTGTALGEIAYRIIHDENWGMVSFFPSDWDKSRIKVTYRLNDSESGKDAEVPNFWEKDLLFKELEKLKPPIKKWSEFKDFSINKFTNLSFSEKCFENLEILPFSNTISSKLLKRFDILNELVQKTNPKGKRSQRGNELYNEYFKGDRSYFSDSSVPEKQKFRDELTFSHQDLKRKIFCPWHGKFQSNSLQIRFHFSWPIKAGKPCYIVYVGQKITKR